MSEAPLIVDRENGLAVLRLNRPRQLNAIDEPMGEALREHVMALTSDRGVRAILITGEGRAFCAGGDVKIMGRPAQQSSTEAAMQGAHDWMKALRSSHALVITAVNGVAAGGGFGLAMLGDVVLASRTAVFLSGFTDLGAVADFGLVWTLPRAVGGPRAADILFSDRRIPAEDAERIGLVSRIFEPDTFALDARAYAAKLARAPYGATLTRQLLRRADADAFAAFLDAEARAQAEAFQSDDFLEGVAAFKEKRPPSFQGR